MQLSLDEEFNFRGFIQRQLATPRTCRRAVKIQHGSFRRANMLVKILETFRFCSSKTPSPCLQLPKRLISLSSLSLASGRYRPRNRGHNSKSLVQVNECNEENATEDEDEFLDNLLNKTFLRRASGHQVCVIQPYIKWGVQKKRNTTPHLQLLEAVTLIKTLRQWKVVDQVIVSLQWLRKDKVFGSGVLEKLKTRIRNHSKISAVFVSVNTLSLYQQMNLEAAFGVPVYDRYTIIMHIFKEHAHTKEAKLQIQLAQLPYLKTVIRSFNFGTSGKYGIDSDFLGAEGPKLLSKRREMFRAREAKIKREIESLREQRSLMRKQRGKQEIPVVAVIGYTNAGKTSLIKALTGKKSLQPQDYLFATLDVSSHLGRLPSGLQAYFVDTLGFINDIPTYLIESFVSTLEDAVLAHVIIHVRDISHPDTVAQNDNVLRTLRELNLSEEALKNIITVGNKVDLLRREEWDKYRELILVSSTELIGVDVLREAVQSKILKVCDKSQMIIRVEMGSEEYNWLHLWSTVVSETPDPKNSQFMLTEVIISSTDLAKFKHNFIVNYRR